MRTGFEFTGHALRDEHARVHAVATTVASPLALSLLAHEGLDVDAVVSALRPRADWRRWVCGAAPPTDGLFGRWSFGAPSPRPEDVDEIDALLQGGLVLREWNDLAGALSLRVSPAGLEVGARLGGVHLRTIVGLATLTTGNAVPETVRSACVGMPVEAVFGHPVLEGRGHVVSAQYERVPTRVDPREAWRVEFRVEPVQWRVPWARGQGGTAGAGGPARADALGWPNNLARSRLLSQ